MVNRKKIVSAVTSVLLSTTMLLPQITASAVVSENALSQAFIKGDVNFDGELTLADEIIIQRHILGLSNLDDKQFKVADINNDGVVSLYDIVKVCRFVLGTEKPETISDNYSYLKINEVCSSNENGITDSLGNHSDWVEIYNTSEDETIALDGIGLSDGTKKKFKFAFPENTSIKPKDYVIVYCDDGLYEAEGEYHAGFKISSSGDNIYMTAPDEEQTNIDTVSVPAISTDTTYGRFGDGSDRLENLTPTPNASNNDAKIIPPPSIADLVINEVCSSNENGITDSLGNHSDWVEIYNKTNTELSLDGIGLSDGKKKKFKFAFPENSTIPAHGYVVVFCDDGLYEVEGEYHAGFKISSSGDSIYMTSPDEFETNIDTVDVPAIDTDTTYGRYKNGSDNFENLTPTPNASNDTAEIIPPPSISDLVINEVCSSNENGITDSLGNHSDWVEIYNKTNTELSLDGIGLSDGKKKKFKFAFPENSTIPAHGYVVVFCDDGLYEVEGEYHAGFKISSSGDSIYMTAPDEFETNIDTVDVPAIDTDTTYGRYKDGQDNFEYLTPTPNASNNDATVLPNVDTPSFSVESGFYANEFPLELSNKTQAQIYYTTDGSDPTTSETAKLYDSEISIYDNTNDENVYSAIEDINLNYSYVKPNYNVDKGMIIRAVSKDKNGNYSDVITNSYFVNKTAPYYSDMRVISLVTDSDNLFDPDKGIYVIGNRYYEWKNSDSFNSSLASYSPKNPTNYNQSGKEWERPCTIQVFENGQMTYTENVGMRISGNATRVKSQKSITLYARSEYGSKKMKYPFFENLTDVNGNPITSFDKVTLRNGGNDAEQTKFRDDLIQDCASGLKFSKQAKSDCVLFIDGEFWGYYSMQEKIDDEYVEAHFGVKAEDVTTLKVTEGEGDEQLIEEYKRFISWALNADLSVEKNYQRVCDTIDIPSYIDYIAAETYICNQDWGNNNWIIWRANTVDEENPYADGRWRVVMFDTELSTNMPNFPKTYADYDMLKNMNTAKSSASITALFFKLMENESFKIEFYNSYKSIISNNFEPQLVNAKIDNYVDKLNVVVSDTFKRFSIANGFNKYVQRVRTFFNERPAYAEQYLNDMCGITNE